MVIVELSKCKTKKEELLRTYEAYISLNVHKASMALGGIDVHISNNDSPEEPEARESGVQGQLAPQWVWDQNGLHETLSQKIFKLKNTNYIDFGKLNLQISLDG